MHIIGDKLFDIGDTCQGSTDSVFLDKSSCLKISKSLEYLLDPHTCFLAQRLRDISRLAN